MHRGLEVGIYLKPGLTNDDFVAMALGNLAAHTLREHRHEPLEWQVLRVEAQRSHHFRLVIRHPERVLDLGLKTDLARTLDELSAESVEELEDRFAAAKATGLVPVPLRRIPEEVDYWEDPFWRFLGGSGNPPVP